MKKIIKKTTIKKAQSGTKVDKTAVKKPNASAQMKRDNQMAVRVNKSEAKIHDYHRNLDVSAAMKYPESADRMLKAAVRDDSLAQASLRKARLAKAKPTFSVKKYGGNIKKKK